jgi:hypothetical protein
MAEWAGLQTVAHDAIALIGDEQDIQVTSKTVTSNPMGGGVSVSSTSNTVKGAVFRYRRGDVDGTQVLQDDRKVYLSAQDLADKGITIDTDDTLRIGNVKYEIVSLMPNRPGVTTIYERVQVRRA